MMSSVSTSIPTKIRILEEGGIPIYEPGLQEMVRRNVAAGRLHFTTDVEKAVQHGTIQFIAVGTPPDEDGSADLQYVLAAARNIGRTMTDYKVIVDKSTVPVGTADKVKAAVADELREARRSTSPTASSPTPNSSRKAPPSTTSCAPTASSSAPRTTRPST